MKVKSNDILVGEYEMPEIPTPGSIISTKTKKYEVLYLDKDVLIVKECKIWSVGVSFRIRRGKLVAIPKKWRGKVTSKQTIRGRSSKKPHKQRKMTKLGGFSTKKARVESKKGNKAPKDE